MCSISSHNDGHSGKTKFSRYYQSNVRRRFAATNSRTRDEGFYSRVLNVSCGIGDVQQKWFVMSAGANFCITCLDLWLLKDKSNAIQCVTFVIHDLLPDGVTRCLKHLLNSPEKDHVIAAQLNSKENTKLIGHFRVAFSLSIKRG